MDRQASLPICMEQDMRVESAWRTATAWLHRAGRAVRRFFGPFEPADGPEAAGLRKRRPAPFCVSYGRVVFRLHYPEPLPNDRRAAEEVRFNSTRR
jgi:hypothetical protein